MAKSFTGGLNSLLGDKSTEIAPSAAPKPGRKRTNFKEVTSTSQEGTKEGETRATFIVNEGHLQKLKDVAYWDRLSIKEVVNTAIGEYLSKYEKKNGEIKSQP